MRRLFATIGLALALLAPAIDANGSSILGGGNRRPVLMTQPPLVGDLTLGIQPAWVTVTRSGTAWYFGSDGLLTSVGTNVGRYDYDPTTLAAKGLRVEDTRTNVALYSRDMSNAAWVKSSTTAAKDQTGIDGVANSASSVTATGSNGTILQTVTLASSQRFYSAYVKRITGSGAVSMTTDNGSTWTAVTVTASWTKVSIPAQTVTNPVFGFKLATNGDKIAVDCNQNENGASGTSPIVTTSVAVSRNADVVTLAGPALAIFQGAAFSAVLELNGSQGVINATTGILTSNGSQYPIYVNSNTVGSSYNGSAAVTTTIGGSGTFTGTAPMRIAVAGDASGRSFVANNGTLTTDANKVFTSSVTTVYLGSLAGLYTFNGWIGKIALYGFRLQNANLKAVSVAGSSFVVAANDNDFPRYAANDDLPIIYAASAMARR